MARIEVNSKAPDFTLPDLSGAAFTLSDLAGEQRVLLVLNRGFV